MNKFALLLVLVFVQGCAQKTKYGLLNPMGTFPSKLKEVSGLEIGNDNIWVIQDSGNKDEVYKVNSSGKIINSVKIGHAKNEDWEDLAMDNVGNLYIGDFGNNNNTRKNLTIYKVQKSELGKKEAHSKKITFNYPEQKEFPPKKDSLLFDTEGFFHWKDSLYIFTKNRTRPYTGETLIYRVPDTEGDYVAEFLGPLFLCDRQDNCSVTGADISADGKTIALLGYGTIFLLTEFEFPNLDQAKVQVIDLQYLSQIESISFKDANTLLLADEEYKDVGRKLYSYKMD
ncbi:MAG: hypothetical protein R2819_03915 [Allomuricauda sp.]